MMLAILTKRLCPLMSLALAFGCGKKINDPETNSGSTQAQNQELPAVVTVQVDEVVSPITMYALSENAWFKLPTKLRAIQGSAAGRKIKIYYNLLNSGEYEFNCSYSSISSVTEMPFDKCESSDGRELISNNTDLSNMVFPMDKGSSIKMQLTNPAGTGLKIDSTYLVDWK
jgi:hypothetical protein